MFPSESTAIPKGLFPTVASLDTAPVEVIFSTVSSSESTTYRFPELSVAIPTGLAPTVANVVTTPLEVIFEMLASKLFKTYRLPA